MGRLAALARRAALLQGGFWLAAGLLATALAWWAQHVMGLAPCALCLWERWPYRVLALLGLSWIGLAWTGLAAAGSAAGRVAGALVTLALLSAVAVSTLHVGVEQGWWPDPLPACMAPHLGSGTVAQRLAAMPLRPTKPCDSPSRLFGWLPVSMTALDLIYACVLLLGGRFLLPRLVDPYRRAP